MSGEYDRADNCALLETECDILKEKNTRLREVNACLLAACEGYLKLMEDPTHVKLDDIVGVVRMMKEAVAQAKGQPHA